MAMADRKHWDALSEHLDRALEIDASGRDAWLDELARVQPELAAELRALLGATTDPKYGRFLTGPAAVPSALPPRPTMAGRRVGAYRIESEIASGGMGTVWRAVRDDGRFEGCAAVKFVHPCWLGSEGERRFLREGQLLARLQHPHIARLLDAGILEDGQPYLVLEYVEGRPIDVYCDEQHLDVEARVRLFLGVLDAVEHAHSHLVVHRDIKPSNILVSADGTPKLVDFGVARPVGAELDALGLTRPGGDALTPDYAAPEQLLGDPVTTLTDVYALGLVLYRLLAGCTPLARGDRSPLEYAHALLERDAPRASSRTSDARLRQALAGDLDNILARALRRAPSERYASVGAFADDLRRHLADEPVLARPAGAAYRAAKFVRRHRGGVAVTLLLATGLVLVATVATRQMLVARRLRDRAVAELQRAQALNDLMAVVLNESSPAGGLTTGELLARGERLVRSEFATTPVLRAQLLYSIATLYQQASLTSSERRVAQEAHAVAMQAGDATTLALTTCALARSDAVTGSRPDALATVRHEIERLPRDGSEEAARAHCLLSASIIERQLDEGSAALADAQSALALLDRSPGGTAWERLNAEVTLADAERSAGRLHDADVTYQNIDRGFSRLNVEQTGFAATLHNNWALVLTTLGQPSRAARLLADVLDYDRNQGTPDAYTRVNYASVLLPLGRADEARRLLEPALADAIANGNRRSAAMVRMALAGACRELGDLDRSASLLDEEETELRAMLPAGHEAFGSLHLNRALLAQKRGDYPSALREADTAMAIFAAQPALAPRAATTRLTRAEILLAIGRIDEAEAESNRARTDLERIAGPDARSFYLGRAWLLASRIAAQQGRTDAARSAAMSAHEQLAATVGEQSPTALEALRLTGTR